MIKIISRIVCCICLFIISAFVVKKDNPKKTPEFLQYESRWVDSVYDALSADERIAQLFMVAAYSNKDMKHVAEIRELIQKYNIGGLIFMQGGPLREAKLTNYYQDMAKTPLLISIDGEWGLAMRLDSTARYPRQMTLGAIKNDSLIYQMGQQIGRECKRLGIHVNFAPVADINNNPANPVIGTRSFGEDKYKVAQKAVMYMKGLQSVGVMANGKHFPGHGDTDSDSHKTLPIINHNKARLDTLELYPFKRLFEEGLSSIMVAHLFVPKLDSTKNRATTLSPYIVNQLLKTDLGFQGLVFTDALNMKGVASFYEPGIVDVKALLAGNDVLLFAENVPKAIEQIKLALNKGEITQEEINIRCKKILKAKFWCGLNQKPFVNPNRIYKDLNSLESNIINTKLAEASVTLLKDDYSLIKWPGSNVESNYQFAAVVSIGDKNENIFNQTLNTRLRTKFYGISHDATEVERTELLKKLENHGQVILQVNKTNYTPQKNFGLSQGSIDLISKICNTKLTITVLYSNPYILNILPEVEKSQALFEVYESNRFSQRAAAMAILSQIPVNGSLPVSTNKFKAGTGIVTNGVQPTMSPTWLYLNRQKLNEVDSIALSGIKEGAYPGCQIVAMKDGEVIYQKSFGKLTYDQNAEKVNDHTVYDLASLTKILSTTLALMKLSGEKKFDYNQTLGYYFPELKGTDKYDLNYKDILTHQAGLQPFIPFYTKTLDKKNNYLDGYYSPNQTDVYQLQVAKDLYINKTIVDSIYKEIAASRLITPKKYVYSDVGYYYSKKLIENITGKSLNEYVKQQFYKPLNVGLTYLPIQSYPLNQIAPTENDTKFRKQLIRGYVHDQGAAMMGGVAGHAGLFGNAKDVAVVMQMLLNDGRYKGDYILDSATVSNYTCSHFSDNRRGLGFDKPEFNDAKDSPVTAECSLNSFGHSGFTGTFAWADPKNNLIFVFLSNRVYPNADENKLAKLGIRSKIHKVLYEAVTP